MKNLNNDSVWGSKKSIAAVIFSFVAVIAIMGTYTYQRFQNNMEEQIAKSELEFKANTLDEIGSELANTNDIINELPEIEPITTEREIEEVNTTEITNQALNFDENSGLMWPIDGGVIMRYSMDQSIYFKTLDQYKRNDALVIESNVGAQVMASEYGVVLSIVEDVETGRTLTVDMGNGYHAIYGQLTEIKVNSGSVIEKGQIIAEINEPTRYYVEEGPNLYFKLMKDDVAIDPMDFME